MRNFLRKKSSDLRVAPTITPDDVENKKDLMETCYVEKEQAQNLALNVYLNFIANSKLNEFEKNKQFKKQIVEYINFMLEGVEEE